jgi:hypothetical protein
MSGRRWDSGALFNRGSVKSNRAHWVGCRAPIKVRQQRQSG